jgi:hypothetical protein
MWISESQSWLHSDHNQCCKIRNSLFYIILSAHLSWNLMWAFLIACYPSSICQSDVCLLDFYIFNLHTPSCVVRGDWMGWSFGWDRKTEVLFHNRFGTIKIPPCSKALSAKNRPKFYSPSPAMVTSPYKWNNLKRDVIWRTALFSCLLSHARGCRPSKQAHIGPMRA